MDAADQEKIEASKNELHNLLDKPQLQGIPVSSPMEWEGREPAGKSLGPGQEAEESQALQSGEWKRTTWPGCPGPRLCPPL